MNSLVNAYGDGVTRMPRSAFTFLLALFPVLVLTGFCRAAWALNHVSALRSGKVIVTPVVVRAPLLTSAVHTDVIPVLMSNPGSPSQLKAYEDALGQLRSPEDSRVLKVYGKLISSLSLDPVILGAAQKGVQGVSWIKGDDDVSLRRDVSNFDSGVMKRITEKAGKDAVVFVIPLVVFSPDFSRVYVMERVEVFAWGPVHSFFLGSDMLYSGFSLLDTKPAIEVGGMQDLAASQQTGERVASTRASVWFANHGRRLLQAIKSASGNLVMALSSYLQGHS